MSVRRNSVFLLSFLCAFFLRGGIAQLPNATDTTATPAAGAHDYFKTAIETVNPGRVAQPLNHL